MKLGKKLCRTVKKKLFPCACTYHHAFGMCRVGYVA